MSSPSAPVHPYAPEVATVGDHLWRREPYRLFFPLGLLLSWAGVGHWFLHSLGLLADFKPIFHAMTQIQGFLSCFAIGFLYTMIPRRTQTAPPSWAQVAIGAIAPIATTYCAWNDRWALAQVFWLLTCGTLIAFLVGRIRATTAKRRPPNSFVWLPFAFAMGMGGSVLAGVGAVNEAWWLHHLGQTFVLQGMFVALVLGVSGLAIPLMTRGAKPADGTSTPADVRARAFHGLAALLLIASFVIEALASPRIAYGLRGALTLVVLLRSAEIYRRPTVPGWNRWLIWLAVWMVPLGFFAAAALEMHPRAGLHVTFIGGLAMLTLAVSTQVILAHGGFDDLLRGRLWATLCIGCAGVIAVLARVTMDLDPDRYFMWMAIASGAFLSATLAWATLLLPKLWPRSP